MLRSSSASLISTRQSSPGSSRGRDPLGAKARSLLMARVRQRDTGPEQIVRSILHNLGLRFTVSGPSNRSLPSRPDIVLPRWRTVVLVHGCFWHRHPGCRLATTPANRAEFWAQKFRANVSRDRRQRRALQKAGWRVVTVWECETRRPGRLAKRLLRSFSSASYGIPAFGREKHLRAKLPAQ
jgi:DNA mismatch endonuclease, patch repair protein